MAADVGVSVSEFWDMTPYELSIMVEAFAKRRKEEQKESLMQAYLISRWVWAKKIDIKKELAKIDGTKVKKRIMTDEEMERQARAITAMFGGEIIEGVE